MARTPDVVSNETITSAWGNEIRDRTCQVFASLSELNAWAAPSGALGVTTDTRRIYQRTAGVWRIYSAPTWAGASQVTTFGTGQANFIHSLGVTPNWAQIQPRTPSAWAWHYIQSMSSTGVTVLCLDRLGGPLDGVVVNAYIEVGL